MIREIFSFKKTIVTATEVYLLQNLGYFLQKLRNNTNFWLAALTPEYDM